MMNLQRAFTFLELMITLALISIITALSMPLLRHFGEYDRAMSLQWRMLRMIQLARNEARIRGVSVVICHHRSSICPDGNMYRVAAYANEQSNPTILAMVQIREYQGALHWRLFPKYRNDFLFYPTGVMQSDNGTLWFCSTSHIAPVWAIVINKAGRARAISPDENDKIYGSDGKPLRCDET
ncbi:GspH/FimT family pseudopilin [Aquicella lusitana]|uniref:Type II secretion system protein H n=1 Tax=Aquicella lusitana TaxID=254246 RepID=A0A370GEZ2_9COXI|nr:GspH/FimT family pseudopilin [Aquicella lusitana]RDI41840.1 prepilin-type N-terminal cleavage/methylation domain-containing protein [Aquicella lusitana]VVC73748.1 hypothetical protein AQULUS_14970 [Aquicella lusitana]